VTALGNMERGTDFHCKLRGTRDKKKKKSRETPRTVKGGVCLFVRNDL